MKTLTISLSLLLPFVLFAHGDKEHTETSTPIQETQTSSASKLSAYKSINTEYLKKIQPIFEKKCFDCHGKVKNFPWYYVVPGVKQMIDYDIKEAKKHIDMSGNFPFISHESPLQDLQSLKEVAIENDMPPFRYLLGHWDAKLTDEEKQLLLEWSDQSILKLKGVRHE